MTTTLKFANVAAIGDTIRAYDFQPMPDRGNSFVEGIVTAKGRAPGGFDAYTIKASRDVFGGVQSADRVGSEVYVPFETSRDWDGRVIAIVPRKSRSSAS